MSNWDPASATLENTSATEKFNFTTCKVTLTEDAKSVDALNNATVKIIGFGDQVIYNDKASDIEITCTGLTLDKSSTTNLVFEINDFLDVAQLDSMFDKQIFKISLGAEKAIPEHENLCEYSLDELRQISNYLAENYSEESTDPICVKFRNFRNNGLKSDGSDNGVAMNEELKNHWAIDANGKLFGEDDFINDKTTIQARIIGICEDVDKDNNKIGLTFMTTHALSMVSIFEGNTTEFAKYGWAGPTEEGSCTLRAKLADGTLFPAALNDYVTAAQKGYEFSSSLGSGIAIDKFWAPSMAEMYGSDLSGDNRWPANDTTEGKQYTAFKIKGITSSEETCKPFGFLGMYQDRSSDRTAVWTRSLWKSLSKAANDISGSYAGSPSGRPGSSNVDNMNSPGIIACFCI